jgi:mutator protein MutT
MTVVDAALAVVVHRDHVLLVRRRNPPDAGLWGYPGGRVEPGEAPAEAAIRELREETGVEARPSRALTLIEVRQEGFAFDLHAHLCSYVTGTPAAADDVSAAEWVPAHEVLARSRPMSRDVDAVLRLALG